MEHPVPTAVPVRPLGGVLRSEPVLVAFALAVAVVIFLIVRFDTNIWGEHAVTTRLRLKCLGQEGKIGMSGAG